MPERKPQSDNSFRQRLHEVIFEADTPAGKLFDLALIYSIIISVLVVMLDSVSELQLRYGQLFFVLEWGFTLLFTVEYLLRLSCIGRPLKYATSFFGIVDLLSIVPSYLSLFLPSGKYLLVIRILRLLRVFRVLKLVQYVGEANYLLRALQSSRRKVLVFLLSVVLMMVIFGSVMYIVEGPEHGFTSIPRSVYWAIVTMTTVGYGDISPQTDLGQALASLVMIIGYGIIAIPTGIVTAELTHAKQVTTQSCPQCSAEGHAPGAKHCKDCGALLNP
ncbi:voltage-gated potassium channel [Malonomonas rubra DSM 5091]|uniref:Voltage-gated potassium channel n=1 Tax=Malonomonas rubra DSM 5091 TaxID=1122189 RepID=A0A1M6GBU8_MALRU|nr:ion transporter [Malonomonas rubra]SHJ07405.1 voltage-gated potassium channel [Malonomonas rubra DSM 5091]